MSIKHLTLISLLLLVGYIRTALVPTAPSGGQSFDVGSPCPYQYSIDQSGIWNNVTIQLMTGDNFNMIPVTTVATQVDGTKGTGIGTWTCPSVLPNSAIYFYQFTLNGATLNPTWTTRFTIASSSGSSTPPTNSTQPGGALIAWGVGRLVNAAANATVSTSSSSLATTSSTVRPTTTSNSTTMVTSTSFLSTGTSISPSATSTKSSSPSERRATMSGVAFFVFTLALIV